MNQITWLAKACSSLDEGIVVGGVDHLGPVGCRQPAKSHSNTVNVQLLFQNESGGPPHRSRDLEQALILQ